MRAIEVCLILMALVGTSPAAEDSEKQDAVVIEKEIVLPLEAWEFKETDGHLWLHFHRIGDKDRLPDLMAPHVQLAGIDTKFVPLVYFKGTEEERNKQKEINDAIAAFIAEQLKGKTVWIEDAKPAVFAGPRQVLGVVWFDADRKRSLQQLLLKKGLAVKKSRCRTMP